MSYRYIYEPIALAEYKEAISFKSGTKRTLQQITFIKE